MSRDSHPDARDVCSCAWCRLGRALDDLADRDLDYEGHSREMAAALLALDTAGVVDQEQFADALSTARRYAPRLPIGPDRDA